jgi:hypothetical protein
MTGFFVCLFVPKKWWRSCIAKRTAFASPFLSCSCVQELEETGGGLLKSKKNVNCL